VPSTIWYLQVIHLTLNFSLAQTDEATSSSSTIDNFSFRMFIEPNDFGLLPSTIPPTFGAENAIDPTNQTLNQYDLFNQK
jgi:hypothetical protein